MNAVAVAEPVLSESERTVLDSARTEFERHGLRRANMDAIARRAGVSRRTLYRRFPTKEALFEQLVAVDVAGVMGQLGVIAQGHSAQEAIIECFTLGMRLLTENPLMVALIESEPELVAGVNTSDGTKAIEHASALVASTLRHAGVTMPDEAVLTVSELLVRLTISLLINRTNVLDITDGAAVRRYAETYLARLVW